MGAGRHRVVGAGGALIGRRIIPSGGRRLSIVSAIGRVPVTGIRRVGGRRRGIVRVVGHGIDLVHRIAELTTEERAADRSESGPDELPIRAAAAHGGAGISAESGAEDCADIGIIHGEGRARITAGADAGAEREGEGDNQKAQGSFHVMFLALGAGWRPARGRHLIRCRAADGGRSGQFRFD